MNFENINKTFGSVVANKDISINLKKGEILALLGENGSGKSTLMNLLSGIYQPDSGFIYINGQLVTIKCPEDAIKFGIGMIHQHFKLVDVMSAKENILIGRKEKKNVEKNINELMDKYGLIVPIDKYVRQMTVSEKQTLEIIKVLYGGASILILDEPTAVLTPQEIEKLFAILKKMKEKGQSIIIITHKLNEVMEISDRVTVLRKGEHIKTVVTSETNPIELTELMVGASIDLNIARPVYENKKRILKCEHLTVIDKENVKKLNDVSFDLYGGEILGIAGISNSGQKELCEALAGLQAVNEGKVLYENVDLIGKKPREIFDMGVSMSFIPEDRLGMGLVADMGMVNNMILKDYYTQKGLFLNRKETRKKAKKVVEQLKIVTPSVDCPVKKLSGGNIQKVLLGRELDASPHVLITAYPVRGLDIGSSMTIFDKMNEQKMNGVGVIFIGEDLDMLIGISDRIMVLCNGKITGIVDSDIVTKDQLGLLMTGKVEMYV
ncbi:MAG: ABC transporter ATP-binding protein [Clostridia bacterium]|nr:ABC transporter ATP-binding protein [Clostridia bacterium]